MRELEKYYFDYIILGIPKRAFRYFLRFFIKRGIRPTVYAPSASRALEISGLAKFCISDTFLREAVILDFLERHALHKTNRKPILIVKDKRFDSFVEKNEQKLEKLFVIHKDYHTGDANEA